MKEFKGKVAVVTGAASGIGRAIAERCAQEGMCVVLADIEKSALDSAAADLTAKGANVLAVQTDVSNAAAVEALAQQTIANFGAVHLLVNNAGVAGGNVSTGTLADWEWVLGVNLWGVIHGVRVFTPIMLKQDTECHIVNTASVAGLLSGGLGIYSVSKHAVVALSESLYGELAQINAKIKVSVLCPGFVRTQIGSAARNRPSTLHNEPVEPTAADEAFSQAMEAGIQSGMLPEEVADILFEAVANEKFYILPNAEAFKPAIQARLEGIIEERNPLV